MRLKGEIAGRVRLTREGTRAIALGAFTLVLIALFLIVIRPAHAEEIPIAPDVQAWADYALIDPVDLQGAVTTTGLGPEAYLVGVGDVIKEAAPAPIAPSGWPIGGALGQRIYCIEGLESHHGVAMYNPTPVVPGGEHAHGWLGYLDSTAAVYGVVVGNRASEWRGAAAIIGKGEQFAGTQFYGIGSGRC